VAQILLMTPKFFTTTALLIDELYSRKATERKDMAYGVCAILQRLGATNLPAPDYSHTTGDVYRRLTTCIMMATRSLDTLLLAAFQNLQEQPSWVPDWSAHGEHVWQNLDELQYIDSSGALIDGSSPLLALVITSSSVNSQQSKSGCVHQSQGREATTGLPIATDTMLMTMILVA
jgi:hypothetical protein